VVILSNCVFGDKNERREFKISKESYLGFLGFNKHGTPFKVVEYKNTNSLIIEFQDEYKYRTKSTVQNVMRGQIKNPYDKIIYGIAYIGDGQYKSVIEDNANNPMYINWRNMLKRCYCPKFQKDNPTYIGCTVVSEWHNYQNYGKWHDDNYYDVGDGRMHLDKDILIRGNKLYSPETCIYVPQRINMLFMEKRRKSEFPTGILKRSNKYCAMYNTEYLGLFDTIDEAQEEHMKAKRLHIKRVADEYKSKIPERLYNALYEW